MIFHSIERLPAPFHSVSEVGVVIPPRGQGEAAVLNREFKLLFFLEADCAMAIDGWGELLLAARDILVMPRAGYQRYRVAEKGHLSRVHALKISFVVPALAARGPAGRLRGRKADPEEDFTIFVQHHFTDIRHLPHAQTPAMQEIMRGIRIEGEQHRPGIRHRVSALCTNLTVHVARCLHDMPARSTAAAPGYGSLVNQTKEFLLRNFARELTLSEIAWHSRKSEEHLARVFRRATGQTVFDYLRTIRLESAKTMLIDSEKPLTEIARSTGFSSLALFSRNFSQYVGQNASAYRNERALTAMWRDSQTKPPPTKPRLS